MRNCSTLDDESQAAGLKLLQTLRAEGINTELYPDFGKMKKHFQYADKKHIPFVVIIGSEELNSNMYSLKDLQSGEQNKYDLSELLGIIKK